MMCVFLNLQEIQDVCSEIEKKQQDYQLLVKQAQGLLENESDLIANAANLSALLFNQLENINWAGFYLVKGKELVLGPFQGQVACVRIPIGRGVCGTAAANNEVQLVDDVHQFEGHIACDSASNSEIVLPISVGGKVVAVLDIDSPNLARFDTIDQQYLSEIARVFIQSSEWPS